MSKLVDKDRLAKLAKALDNRAKAAVQAEQERALAAEALIDALAKQNKAAIEEINGAEGLLAKANEAIANEKLRAEEAEGALSDRIDNFDAMFKNLADDFFAGVEEGDGTTLGSMVEGIAENKAAIVKLNGAATEEGSVAKAVKDAIDKEVEDRDAAILVEQGRATGVEQGLDARIKAFEEGENSVAKQIENAVKAEADRAKEVEEDHEERIAANEAFVAAQPAVDAAQDGRIKALEDDAPVKQAAIEAAQKAADDAQDAADAVAGRATVLEGQMTSAAASIAVLDGADDVEGSVKKQIKDAVKAEADLRVEEDGKIREELEGAIAQEVTDRNAAIDVEKQRAEGVEAAIRQELANEKKALQDEIDADVKVEKERAELAEQELSGRLDTAEAALEIINGEGAGSIKKAEADAKAHAEAKIAELVDSAPDAMNTLNELAKAINDNKDIYDAYIEEHATAMSTMKTDLQAEIDADVKVVADELAKQKDAEQDGTLAKQIADNKAAIEQEVEDREGEITRVEGLVSGEASRAAGEEAKIRQELANEKAALQAEIDADVKVVADELVKQKDAEQEGTLANQIADEVARATGKEGELQTAITNEADKAREEEGKLADKIAAIEDLMGIGGEEGEAGSKLDELQGDIEAAQGDATQALADAAAAQADVDAVEKRLDDEGGLVDRLEAAEAFVSGHSHEALQGEIDAAEGRLDVLEAFVEAHDHTAMEQGIAANAKAIEDEVKEGGARDAAIEAALATYSDTEEVKGMLTNVINSLGLAIADNKLQLTLGTNDFVIKEVELDMATDADIDAIIAGLDETAAE